MEACPSRIVSRVRESGFMKGRRTLGLGQVQLLGGAKTRSGATHR